MLEEAAIFEHPPPQAVGRVPGGPWPLHGREEPGPAPGGEKAGVPLAPRPVHHGLQEAAVVRQRHVRPSRRTQRRWVVGEGAGRLGGEAPLRVGPVALDAVGRRAESPGGDPQGLPDPGPDQRLPVLSGGRLQHGARNHVPGIGIEEGGGVARSAAPACRPACRESRALRLIRPVRRGQHGGGIAPAVGHRVPQGVGAQERRHHRRFGVGRETGPMGQELGQRRPAVSRMGIELRQPALHRVVPRDDAGLHQAGHEHGGHGLGVRAQVPAIVRGDGVSAPQRPLAGHSQVETCGVKAEDGGPRRPGGHQVPGFPLGRRRRRDGGG